MNDERKRRGSRRLKGPQYTIEAFAEKYKLQLEEARNLFEKFGPSSVDLDILMSARRMRKSRVELPDV